MAISDPHTTTTTTSLASDRVVRPFLAPTFDPVDYLNAVLPSWTPGRQPPASSYPSTTSTASLIELVTQSNTLLSQLSAQLTRLSSTLSKLTDDILRAGGRLAYEVEVLQADAGTLHEVLTDGLREDIERFVPGGLVTRSNGASEGRSRGRSRGMSLSAETPVTPMARAASETEERKQTDIQPAPRGAEAELHQLRTLALVRDRLESVIKVFGAAIEWVTSPSEVSIKSSFISVSGPESSAADVKSREEKGKAYAERMRGEIAELAGPRGEGAQSALARIEQLRRLAEVWKGTSEEKARLKFLDELTKAVEDSRRNAAREVASSTGSGYRYRAESQPRGNTGRR